MNDNSGQNFRRILPQWYLKYVTILRREGLRIRGQGSGEWEETEVVS